MKIYHPMKKNPYHLFYKYIVLLLVCFYSFTNDPISSQTTVQIQSTAIQSNFQGMGYNMAQNSQFNGKAISSCYSTDTWNNVLGKRIREVCSHGYFRNFGFSVNWYAPTMANRTWLDANFVNYCNILKALKDNDIDIHVCFGFETNPAWLGGGKLITDPVLQDTYAQVIAQGLSYMIDTLGLTNIKSWEIGNELTIKDSLGAKLWGGFYGASASKPSVISQNCHKALITKVRAALNAKGLNSLVIRSGGMSLPDYFNFTNDNHPESSMSDFHWYGVYSNTSGYKNWGSTYGVTPYPPTTTDTTWYLPEQYTYFSKLYKYRVARAKTVSKLCSIGEYGPIGTGNSAATSGIGSAYPGTEYGAIGDGKLGTFFADQAIAMLNAGIVTIQKWSLVDLKYSTVQNHYFHGSMTDSIDGWQTRSDWYSYGLMTRYIRKNSTVYNLTCSDSMVHIAAVQNNGDGHWTIVVMNRKATDNTVNITFNGALPSKPLRKFVYNPIGWPQNALGDLQAYSAKVTLSGTVMSDVVMANTMALYTTEYDETPPASVSNLSISQSNASVYLTWNENAESDFCYYRVYMGFTPDFTPTPDNYLSSTIARSYKGQVVNNAYYKVLAVDKYGNCSTSNNAVVYVPNTTELATISQDQYRLYPNPSVTSTTKMTGKNIANLPLQVTDILGREVEVYRIVVDENTITIGLKNSKLKGVVFVRIISKKGQLTYKWSIDNSFSF